MWLLGLIWLTISLVANIFLSSIAPYIALITNIIISIKFKEYYLKHVEEQVNKIKTKNPNKTKEQLMIICSQKGGTTVVPVIIAIITYIITIIIAFASILSTYYGHTNTIDDLKVTVPDILILSDYSNDTFKIYHADYNKTNEYCTLEITTTNAVYYDNDAKKYLENRISNTNTSNEISRKRINRNNWYYAKITTKFNSEEYYYTIAKNGTIYKVKFEIYSDEKTECTNAYNTIIKSLEFK